MGFNAAVGHQQVSSEGKLWPAIKPTSTQQWDNGHKAGNRARQSSASLAADTRGLHKNSILMSFCQRQDHISFAAGVAVRPAFREPSCSKSNLVATPSHFSSAKIREILLMIFLIFHSNLQTIRLCEGC